MMRRFGLAGSLLAAMVSVLVSVSAGPATGHESPQHGGPVVPVLSWGPCDGDVRPVYQCATARVPLDHRKPRGKTVELALIRHPASDQVNKIGSLFLAHPLGMFDFVADAPPGALAAFSRFDVIGYDGRGAARARPAVDCDTDRSLYQPFTTRETAPRRLDVPAMVAAAKQYAKQCLAAAGELLPHLSTATMARDLDLLRQAAGDTRLSYIGISQGTVIGATYASMFPGRVRAMVFDAPVDSATWLNDPLRAFRDQAAETEDVLGRFFTACAAKPLVCGFGNGDPRAAFDRLMRRLDRHPLPSPDPADPFPVDGDDVRKAANEATYSPLSWAPLAAALADAERGDVRALRHAARHGFQPGATVNDPSVPEINLWFANLAADGRFPHRLGTYLDNGAENRRRFPHVGSGVLSSGYDLLIPGLWPVGPSEVHRGPFRNSAKNAPILLIGGTHDPATPYRWAQRLGKELGNARLMTFDSEGHGALNDGDPCVLIPVLTYLTDGRTLPAPGTTCKQQFEPFSG